MNWKSALDHFGFDCVEEGGTEDVNFVIMKEFMFAFLIVMKMGSRGDLKQRLVWDLNNTEARANNLGLTAAEFHCLKLILNPETNWYH